MQLPKKLFCFCFFRRKTGKTSNKEKLNYLIAFPKNVIAKNTKNVGRYKINPAWKDIFFIPMSIVRYGLI
jgi:hypothetical protein